MTRPNEWSWYKNLHKKCAIKIHNCCFNNTKKYKIGWGTPTGWYLNDGITAYATAIWKVPIWLAWLSLAFYIIFIKYLLLMCGISVIQRLGGNK